MTKKFILPILTLSFLALNSACLKTRAQLKDDHGTGDELQSKSVPAKIEDVQPQGQYVIDEIKGELTRLTGRIEDLERAQKQTEGQDAAAKQDQIKSLENRIIELEKAQANMIDAMKKSDDRSPTADPSELYEKGKADFEAGKLDGAIESLSAYLAKSKGKHLESATFLRAEAYFVQKQFKKAIVDYSKFPEKFPKSLKMPAALYKIGQSFDGLGMREDAKGFYQELVEKFPKSSEAKKAKAKLK